MASYNVLFVSEEKLKAFTSIHHSVSPTDLSPYILQSQDIYLHQYLGSTFYNQLKSQVLTSNLTTANRTILDNYIAPMLCNLAMMHCLPFLSYKVFNKSVLKPGSEGAQNIGLDELKFLIQQTREVAESYTKQLQLYLKNNSDLYPAWSSGSLLDGMLPDKGTPYFSGIQTKSKYFNRGKHKVISDALGLSHIDDDDECCED